MTEKSKLTEQTDRGQRSEIVLQELDGAFTALEADCFDSFKNSDIHDDEGRLACRIYLRILDDVKSRFEYAVQNGEVARKALTELG